MARKANAELMIMDRRIILKKVLAGEIGEKELNAMLKKLPDVSDNAEEVPVEETDSLGS